ncbi:MAG: hypothetical protein IJ232_08995 [Lachnospiraceae bacterium]|nr:hypothetical protein [Lachnospiraceae bacterium]
MNRQLITISAINKIEDIDSLKELLGVDGDKVQLIVSSEKDVDNTNDLYELYKDHNRRLRMNLYVEGEKDQRIAEYLAMKILPLMEMLGEEGIKQMDELLRAFYILNDSSRDYGMDIIRSAARHFSDPERTEQVEKLDRW